MDILVGYTGFVGSNLNQQHEFSAVFNSKNIAESYNLKPDLCIYAGVRAEKFLANNDPNADRKIIEIAAEQIRAIQPKRLVLISTIDVFKTPLGVDEGTIPDKDKLQAYGLNRLYLEYLVTNIVENYHIIRLPALFGMNIKKNFIYDLINIIPAMLDAEKYNELSEQSPLIKLSYKEQLNGFFTYTSSKEKNPELRMEFERIGFTALNFTDSRSEYQFYNLSNLWQHIDIAIKNNISLLHLATEPLSAAEIFYFTKGRVFLNEITQHPAKYNFRTKHDVLFGGRNGYLSDKNKVLSEIAGFVRDAKQL